MKKVMLSVVAVMSFIMTGCFSEKIDSTPVQLNKDESFAMQVLKSGFHRLPFNIPDASLVENGYYDTLSYTAIHTLDLAANSGAGGLSRLGLVASGGIEKDLIHYIAWVPADNIDITDTDAINDYIHQHYLSPAVTAFVASDFNLQMKVPTELLKNDAIDIKVKGGSCWPIALGEKSYDECAMFSADDVTVVRYATVESGLPFEPSIKASRYIIVRITGNLSSIGAIKHINSNMIYAYMPAFGETAQPEHLNRFSALNDPIVSKNLAYVIGAGRKVNYFAKIYK